MPSKKKKYNARFPAGRIKKIMQSDEDIGKVAQAVPVIISRTLELFVESLLTKTLRITNSRNAKTLSTSHMKQCIMSEQRFDFLRELVKNVPDISVAEEAANYNEEDGQSSPDDVYPDSDTPYDLSMPSTSGGRNQYRTTTPGQPKVNGGQTHFQYKQQQQQQQYQLTPHNGSTIDTAAIEADLRQRLRQRLNNTRSVIVHTASVAQAAAAAARPPPTSPATATPAATPTPARGAYGNYVQPIKLMRSESSPANAAQHLWQVSSNSATQKQTGQKRLRHQALSVPCNNNNDNCTGASPGKRQKPDSITQQTHSQTAIPAPVFSYDLCNKPVVKIDYSNLPLTPATLGASEQPHTTPSMSNLPLSAPATNANFNFSAAAPIINIDLSNIVTNSGGSGDSKLLSAGNKPPVPAVATISIGALPVEMASAVASPPASGVCSNIGAVVKSPPTSSTPPTNQLSDCKIDGNAAAGESTSSASSSCCSPSSSSLASTSANSLQGGGSKSMLKASSEIMAKMTAAGTKTLAATCKSSNTLLELDEDYDNI